MGVGRSDRRSFLKGSAALAGGLAIGVGRTANGQVADPERFIKGNAKLVAYDQRSRFETAVRISHSRPPSPDAFGLIKHVATPIQESVGVITPSALHYVGTTRGHYIPDIDPDKHRLMIHGMVDRPLTFSMTDLKRLPSVTRLHFVECAANRPSATAESIQVSHGMTRGLFAGRLSALQEWRDPGGRGDGRPKSAEGEHAKPRRLGAPAGLETRYGQTGGLPLLALRQALSKLPAWRNMPVI